MMQYIFFSDLHTICNLFENMIFVNISWWFFFSPSVLYLSQSLLHSDLSMFYRLAHEVCHTWFGIVIGPLDWTEEWLTEGFCTYLEDIIHTRVLKVKNIKLCAFINICWIPISVGWTTKLISDLWTAVSNNKLFEYEDNLRWIYICLKLLFSISPQKLMPTKIMETTIHMYYNICFMLKEVTPCLRKYTEFTTCRICF